MAKKYRVQEYRFLNKEEKTTRVIYTPQIFFDGDWCHIKDDSTETKLVEFETEAEALENAKELYEELQINNEY